MPGLPLVIASESLRVQSASPLGGQNHVLLVCANFDGGIGDGFSISLMSNSSWVRGEGSVVGKISVVSFSEHPSALSSSFGVRISGRWRSVESLPSFRERVCTSSREDKQVADSINRFLRSSLVTLPSDTGTIRVEGATQ